MPMPRCGNLRDILDDLSKDIDDIYKDIAFKRKRLRRLCAGGRACVLDAVIPRSESFRFPFRTNPLVLLAISSNKLD